MEIYQVYNLKRKKYLHNMPKSKRGQRRLAYLSKKEARKSLVELSSEKEFDKSEWEIHTFSINKLGAEPF